MIKLWKEFHSVGLGRKDKKGKEDQTKNENSVII